MTFSRLLLGSNPRAALMRSAVVIITAVVVFRFVLLPIRMTGISMLPTYRDGAFDVANRLAYWSSGPARGDVVAIRMAGPSVVYVKRIVALPHERIEITAGVVLVDGTPLIERTVRFRAPWNMRPVTLGNDEYFVIGDNRGMAMQNHDFGRVSRARILGKLLF